MNSGNFTNKNHCIGLNQYHFEFCPKYRYKSLRSQHVKDFLKSVFYEIADKYKMIIHTLAIENDHVHLFTTIPVNMSVSKAFQLLKGISAYKIFRKFTGFQLRYLKRHFWSRGYFYRSVSNVTSSAINNYINNQDTNKLNETIENLRDEPNQLGLLNFY
ncbi:MAG: IS200/IS605 family transposase [Candidatus Micrarchaeia archaeon]|jgi:putative transposase